MSTSASPFLPSRQSTGGAPWDSSTVASEGDLPPFGLRHNLESRLDKVREQRGWKYFLLHRLRTPLAFGAGIGVGALATLALVTAQQRWLQAERSTAPAADGQGFYPAVAAPSSVPDEYLMSVPLDNSCLISQLDPVNNSGPQTFDACGFVIRSTDEVWNLRGDVDEAIEKYFHKDYYNAGSWGKRGVGKKELRDAIFSQMRAFPDLQIHITDCVCKGNDVAGYKCAMPDLLTGTNLGPSAYGPATGRFARWTGMVESLVKRDPASGQWQYVAEWGVHDEWALIQQLGLDFGRVPHPATNAEPLHDCTPLVVFEPEAARMNRFDKSIQDRRGAEQQ
mmetsp:Transcript_72035/g.201052  ORF Transcript_72035/g.201052 Transcript_72035/m.201052 type:complete len:336 (+) Transcript_72035:98-1105(+)